MVTLPMYSGRHGKGLFEPLTVEDAKKLCCGQHIWFVTVQGDARECKINGKARTWKRDPERVEVPAKYGMYEYTTFYTSDIQAGRLLRLVRSANATR